MAVQPPLCPAPERLPPAGLGSLACGGCFPSHEPQPIVFPALIHARKETPMLCCPQSGFPMIREDDAFVSPSSRSVRFPIEDGIIRAFLPHTPIHGDVTTAM